MPENLRKHTLNLRDGDWDYLSTVYKSQGYDTSRVIRDLVSRMVDNLKENESGSVQGIEINL